MYVDVLKRIAFPNNFGVLHIEGILSRLEQTESGAARNDNQSASRFTFQSLSERVKDTN